MRVARAGLVSWCDREGVPSAAIRAVTGHQSEAMMDSYSRPADLFAHSAGAFVDVFARGAPPRVP